MGPDFIIGGGVASGTSFLSAVLSSHAEIFLPADQRPEPNFFHYSDKYTRGFQWYLEKYFQEAPPNKILGDRSSLLLSSHIAPSRIAESCKKDIKIIFCLRNPIQRAWANYRFTALEGLETKTFDDAIKCEAERLESSVGRWKEVQPYAYVRRSMYYRDLTRYLNYFSPEQILLIKSEDLSKNTTENLIKICTFLGIDSDCVRDLVLPPNYTSPSAINLDLQCKLRDHFGSLFSEIVENIRVGTDPSHLLISPLDEKMFKSLSDNLKNDKDPLPQDSKQTLLDLLEDDIKMTQKIVPFSLSDWLQ